MRLSLFLRLRTREKAARSPAPPIGFPEGSRTTDRRGAVVQVRLRYGPEAQCSMAGRGSPSENDHEPSRYQRCLPGRRRRRSARRRLSAVPPPPHRGSEDDRAREPVSAPDDWRGARGPSGGALEPVLVGCQATVRLAEELTGLAVAQMRGARPPPLRQAASLRPAASRMLTAFARRDPPADRDSPSSRRRSTPPASSGRCWRRRRFRKTPGSGLKSRGARRRGPVSLPASMDTGGGVPSSRQGCGQRAPGVLARAMIAPAQRDELAAA